MLSACSSTPEQTTQQTQQTQQTQNPPSQNEIPQSKKVYFFQHKILPEWTFTTDGKFYSDLLMGNLSKLKTAATEVVSAEYASGLKSKVIANENAVLITFPKPEGLTNCFFVLIKKSENSFAFYTYEKTLSFGEDDKVAGVVGSWSEEGNHGNHGGRTYSKAADFIADILNNNS